ncbi:MAG: FHA domain-containing protein [Anaerolinea sp.]|nr:FHA domain-containing protein [Anaerolinea sp.]
MLRLVMRRGPTPGAIYALEGDEINIGRGSKNQIVIRDSEVSREHCRLTRLMDGYEVRDLNSSNGTFINGQRVTGSFVLEPGAILELGDSITLEYDRVHIPLEDTATATSEAEGIEVASEPRYSFRIMMTHGVITGKIFELVDPIITLGRDLTNDIVVQDPEVSRYHLRLRRIKRGYSIEDMGSTNGTFVNGVRLTHPVILNHDDIVKLGSTVQFQFVADVLPPLAEGIIDTRSSPLGQQLPGQKGLSRDETLHGHILRGVRSQVRTSRLGTGLETGTLENHIFIAYHRDDWEPIVASLTLTLQDAGLDVWVDQYLIAGSDDWRAAIEQALLECRLMVVVLSPLSLDDSHVRMAYRHFLGRQRSVIVLRHAVVSPLPEELAGLPSIQYDPDNPRRSFSKLIFEALHQRSK